MWLRWVFSSSTLYIVSQEDNLTLFLTLIELMTTWLPLDVTGTVSTPSPGLSVVLIHWSLKLLAQKKCIKTHRWGCLWSTATASAILVIVTATEMCLCVSDHKKEQERARFNWSKSTTAAKGSFKLQVFLIAA